MKILLACFLLVIRTSLNNAHIPHMDGRIVGGVEANITDIPYQASLRRFSSHVCGAAIFHPFYLLTAAHCVSKGFTSSYSIRAGSNYISKGGTVMTVCSIHIHQNFSQETMENDIAILKLCRPLSFSNYILPVTLASSKERLASGRTSIVSGWGYTEENGPVSDVLKKVEVPIITTTKCQMLYDEEILTDGMICAGYVGSGGKDACQGDSGGPLRANGKLFGIVSWGYGCAHPAFPGVYTNVAFYRNWIKSITLY